MAEFLHTIPLVNKGIKIRCKELCFYNYKNLVKTIMNDSYEDTDFFITELLDELITNYDAKTLDVFDKFILLAYLRCVNVSPELTLECDCSETDKSYAQSIDLNDILGRIDDVIMQNSVKSTYGDLTVTFQLPRSFASNSVNDMCASSIQSISYNGQTIPIISHEYDLNNSHLLNRMPAQLLTKYEQFIINQDKILTQFELFFTKSPFIENGKKQSYNLSFFNDSMLKFIKWIFQDDFQSLYDFEFNLFHAGNLPHEILKTSTLMELQIYTRKREPDQEQHAEPSTPVISANKDVQELDGSFPSM